MSPPKDTLSPHHRFQTAKSSPDLLKKPPGSAMTIGSGSSGAFTQVTDDAAGYGSNNNSAEGGSADGSLAAPAAAAAPTKRVTATRPRSSRGLRPKSSRRRGRPRATSNGVAVPTSDITSGSSGFTDAGPMTTPIVSSSGVTTKSGRASGAGAGSGSGSGSSHRPFSGAPRAGRRARTPNHTLGGGGGGFGGAQQQQHQVPYSAADVAAEIDSDDELLVDMDPGGGHGHGTCDTTAHHSRNCVIGVTSLLLFATTQTTALDCQSCDPSTRC